MIKKLLAVVTVGMISLSSCSLSSKTDAIQYCQAGANLAKEQAAKSIGQTLHSIMTADGGLPETSQIGLSDQDIKTMEN